MRQVDVALRQCGRAVGVEIDAAKSDVRPIDHELGLHLRRHRHEILDGDGAVGEGGGAVIVRQVLDVDVEIAAVHAPRRFVVLERKLAAVGAQPAQRHRHGPRPRRLAIVVVESRKVVRAVPPLDQHLPVGHLHRRDGDVRFPGDRGNPVEAELDPLRGEERTIAFVQAVDLEIGDQHFSGQQTDVQPADVQRTLDVRGSRRLRPLPDHRSEIDRHRRDDRRRQQRDQDRKAVADVAKSLAGAGTREHSH